MTTNGFEQCGIYARRIDAENIVSGIQIQGDDAQSAAVLVRLAQSIRRGDIRADEIKARPPGQRLTIHRRPITGKCR